MKRVLAAEVLLPAIKPGRDRANHSFLSHSLNDPLKADNSPQDKDIYPLEREALSRIPQPALALPPEGVPNAHAAAGLGPTCSTALASPGTEELLYLFPLEAPEEEGMVISPAAKDL